MNSEIKSLTSPPKFVIFLTTTVSFEGDRLVIGFCPSARHKGRVGISFTVSLFYKASSEVRFRNESVLD